MLDFLRRSIQEQQLAALTRALTDPRMWAREARTHPGLLKLLECREFRENTLGDFLQKAIADSAIEERTDNVIELRPRRDKDDRRLVRV